MKKKFLKWTLIVLGTLIIGVVIFYAIAYFNTQSRINKVYSVQLQNLTIPSDSASYAQGKHIAENRGCLGCHGSNLANGMTFMPEASPLGVLHASNITSGKGGVNYSTEDWIRVLRHGLNKENKSVWFMPSHEVNHLSNQDLGSLISYLQKQPPVDKITPPKSIKPLGRILTFLNQFPLLPAELIDHNAQYEDVKQVAVNAEYGAYLATTCKGCHGADFKGAPAHNDKEPNIPNISSTGKPGKWNATDFLTAMRTGKTPEGSQLSDAMPYKEFTYTDDELKAIHMYLATVK